MKLNDTKILNLLILNALRRKDYSKGHSFKIALEDLLKEIDDSINLYIEREDVTISVKDKQKLIQSTIDTFISQEIAKFYKYADRETPPRDMGTGGRSTGMGGNSASSSDDPSGPNW